MTGTRVRTLLVDDEPLAIERLQVLCGRIDGLELAGTAHDAASALRLAGAAAPDLILTDIDMPGLSGVDLAHALARLERPPLVGFVTAHDRFAVPAFELDAVDYLLKPVTETRLARTLERVRGRLAAQASAGATRGLSAVWVPHRGDLIRVDARDVTRVAAERDYQRLHTETGSWLIHGTLDDLEQRFDPDAFVRVHRSALVARNRIARLSHAGKGRWLIVMADGAQVPIGRSHLARVREVARRSGVDEAGEGATALA